MVCVSDLDLDDVARVTVVKTVNKTSPRSKSLSFTFAMDVLVVDESIFENTSTPAPDVSRPMLMFGLLCTRLELVTSVAKYLR